MEISASSLPSGIRIAIYGAGEFGRSLKLFLENRKQSNSIPFFVDSYKDGNFCGVPIYNVGDLDQVKTQFDLIAVASVFGQEIADTLSQKGIENFVVIDLEKFISTDLDLSQYNEMQYRIFQEKDFLPERVLVQFSSLCNLKCKMCPHEKWKSEQPFMSDDVFERVLCECFENGVSKLTLGGPRGESLMHSKFVEHAQKAISMGFDCHFETNGALLNPDLIHRLLNIGLSSFKISFCGYDKNSYESVYVGASFDKILSSLKCLREESGKMANPPSVEIGGVHLSHNSTEGDKSRSFLKNLGFTDKEICTYLADNFAGENSFGTFYPKLGFYSLLPIDDTSLQLCSGLKAWVVYTDGDVGPCGCRNFRKSNLLGNIAVQGFNEMALGEANGAIFDAFRSGSVKKISLCRKCDQAYRTC